MSSSKSKRTNDRGRSRAIPQEIADLLIMLKDENPALSVTLVIRAAREAGVPDDQPLPSSTVHRLLDAHGLMHKRLDQPTFRAPSSRIACLRHV